MNPHVERRGWNSGWRTVGKDWFSCIRSMNCPATEAGNASGKTWRTSGSRMPGWKRSGHRSVNHSAAGRARSGGGTRPRKRGSTGGSAGGCRRCSPNSVTTNWCLSASGRTPRNGTGAANGEPPPRADASPRRHGSCRRRLLRCSPPGHRPAGTQAGFTGQGPTCQISRAYSAIVRSLEKRPERATLRIAFDAHADGSRNSSPRRCWAAT